MTPEELKAATIEAHKALVKKYREPEGKLYFTTGSCPLCKLHFRGLSNGCRGCPLASVSGYYDCRGFDSYLFAHLSRGTPSQPQAFEQRAQFHERVIPIISEWPPERFTPEGWIYSGEEIPRSW